MDRKEKGRNGSGREDGRRRVEEKEEKEEKDENEGEGEEVERR